MLAVFKCKTVIIATGTYLGGRIFVGEVSYESGPDGIFPAAFLGASLKKLGLPSYLSTNAFLTAINCLYSLEELKSML